MAIVGEFRRAARIFCHIEREGWEIVSVKPSNGVELCSRDGVEFSVNCTPSTAPEFEKKTQPMSLVEGLAAFESCTARLHRFDDGNSESPIAVLQISIESDKQVNGNSAATIDQSRLPLHRDHRRLEQLYNEYPTFRDMAAAVDEDISAETIRRYSIEHGIHTPHETSGQNGSGDTEVHQIEEIVEAVQTARTLYDVERSLELDRAETISILREHDLLGFVLGRINRNEDEHQRKAAIEQQIQENKGTGSIVQAGRNG